jgi:hypothetical protein
MKIVVNRLNLETIGNDSHYDQVTLENNVTASVTFSSGRGESTRDDFKILYALSSLVFCFCTAMQISENASFDIYEDYDLKFGSLAKVSQNIVLTTASGTCSSDSNEFLGNLRVIVGIVKKLFDVNNDTQFAWLTLRKGFREKNGIDIEAL